MVLTTKERLAKPDKRRNSLPGNALLPLPAIEANKFTFSGAPRASPQELNRRPNLP